MPLPPAEPRDLLHTREYRFQAYARADGLWDLEGRIADKKPYSFENGDRPAGWVAAGEAIHHMSIRLTLDDCLTVVAIEAVTDAAPYRVCPAIVPNFQRMLGVRIGPGWRRAVASRLAGAEGCTHLVELLYAMATPAFQGIMPALSRKRRARPAAADDAPAGTPTGTTASWPALIDSCHAYAHDGEIARRRWPEAAEAARLHKARTHSGSA
ncbi:MAG: DUF2889 domain-containing protein [Rhodospirillales bacterium]|nr:DUF2889 domain-containing protein [Rhodospirillales bacterium]